MRRVQPIQFPLGTWEPVVLISEGLRHIRQREDQSLLEVVHDRCTVLNRTSFDITSNLKGFSSLMACSNAYIIGSLPVKSYIDSLQELSDVPLLAWICLVRTCRTQAALILHPRAPCMRRQSARHEQDGFGIQADASLTIHLSCSVLSSVV